MHWSLVLLVACCAVKTAAGQDVPAFVCATTEPHPHVQVRHSIWSTRGLMKLPLLHLS